MTNKFNKIHTRPIKDLTGEYITSNTRQGGSYLSNYHKSLPKILLGNIRSGTSDIFLACDLIQSGGDLTITGFVENEYLLADLKIMYRFSTEESFVEIKRDPYSMWSFEINPFEVYSSNYTKIELKLEGLDPQGKVQTSIEFYDIVVEPNCTLSNNCKDSTTEALVDLRDISEDVEMFRIKIGEATYYAESLSVLKDIFQRNNINVDVYIKPLFTK